MALQMHMHPRTGTGSHEVRGVQEGQGASAKIKVTSTTQRNVHIVAACRGWGYRRGEGARKLPWAQKPEMRRPKKASQIAQNVTAVVGAC